ncbi:hypothetical protein DNHGIG_23800 [Collibacillus ludicampi]|uniref:Myb-like domain-containing protein n=1 Tax=Collibacillus ludicampi TaxID=2771369 RepID=A0AAV4LG68_9BACL|nr:hypothetical protein [Collibacillus ludicampi]GIM46831.1 hypothetical protein DNHGIG_23800 [Collibacillus ludicampi]
MAGNPGGPRVDWTEEEFDRLAEVVLETVASGGTVTEACEKFSEESNGLRSVASCRLKWNTILSEKYAAQYEIAKAQGAQARANRTLEERRRIKINRNLPIVSRQQKDDPDEPIRMTQRELIRFLRNVEIVDSNAERLQKQLDEVTRERDELKRQLEKLHREYEEVKAERDKFLEVFNIARKNVAGINDDERKRLRINKHGVVE